MSMAIAHFAIGALTTLLFTKAFASRFVTSPTMLIGGGIWGLVPDVHWVTPVGGELLYSFHHSILANLFFFHRVIDRLDPENSRPLAAFSLCLLLSVAVILEASADSSTVSHGNDPRV